MDIETIKITPRDNIGKILDEAREKSESNNMPVLIELVDHNGKSKRKDRAYLVSRDYYVEVIGKIYKSTLDGSTIFSDDEHADDNPDYNRLKSIINSLYEKSLGGEVFTESINNPKTVNVEIELFPAIDSKTSLAETIYLDESGQLSDISIEDQVFLDQGYYNFLQLEQTLYKIEPRPKAIKQREEYKSAKNGKSSLRRIEWIESNLEKNPMYKERHFEPLVGKYSGLWSRRINGKDRYVYGIFESQRKLIVHSIRGHYD